MANKSLEEYQREMSAQITREIQQQCSAQEQRVQAGFEEKWQQAHANLVAIMRQLDPVYADACEKASRPLQSCSDDDLVFLIQLRLKAATGQAGREGFEVEIQHLRRALVQACEQGVLSEQRNVSLAERISNLQEEISELNTRLHLAQAKALDVPTDGDECAAPALQFAGEPVREWTRDWKPTEEDGPASTVIRIMGETGKALRSAITRELAKRLGIGAEQRSYDALFEELMIVHNGDKPALIECLPVVDDAAGGAAGEARDLVRLTEAGVAAYQEITGKESLTNQYDHLIRSNIQAEEAVLVLQAAAVLEEAGYGIEALAREVPLEDGSRVGVDILGREPATGGTLFVQVERGSGSGAADRRKKWVQMREISGGSLYVICDTLACQRVVQNEMNIALRGLRFSSFLTNLESLRSGKRLESGGIWLSGKQSNYLERLPY